MPIMSHQYIFRFQVSVYNLFPVQIMKRTAKFGYKLTRQFRCQQTTLHNFLQRNSVNVLQHNAMSQLR